MAQPAAKQGDSIVATDTHIIMIPSPGGPVPTPLPHPFTGIIDGNLSADVNIMGTPAATADSTASNTPPHIPQGGAFSKPTFQQVDDKDGERYGEDKRQDGCQKRGYGCNVQ